jgi:hypothetical protein
MGVLTHIVAAEEDELEALGESQHPLDEWSGIEMRDVGIPKIATLHCLLTGDTFDDAAALYEPIYLSSEGALVLRLADEVAERLAELDEDALDAVARELVATEEFETAGWEDEAITEMLISLADLARLAESQGQVLFVWIHPLRT